MSHVDVLDQPERLTVPFWTSVALHVLVFGGLAVNALAGHTRTLMGDPHGGGIGSVQVNAVASIPLPNRGGPENPVANDTQSQMPAPQAPPEKTRPQKESKLPSKDAVPLQFNKLTPRQEAALRNRFRDQQVDARNQLTSSAGQRMSSPSYNMQGGGGPTIGNNSPFGEQFGWYAKIVRDKVGTNWKPVSTHSGGRFVVVTFTIRRDGSIANVVVTQSSGIPGMDTSAQRAVMDAQLPALPSNFGKSQADVELRFELGN